MPDNKDIYGNVDRYSLFYDSRSGTYEWYPTHYQSHPIWANYLTLQVSRVVGGFLYPSSDLYPGSATFTMSEQNIYVQDVSRPMGMHGIGTQTIEVKNSQYSEAIYPGINTYPSSSTYTRNE